MDIKKVIEQRYSVRSYSDKKPPENIIHEIIKYANLAPSAGNLQARDFIIIDDCNIKERLSIAALNQEFINEAPFNIVVCANLNRISSYGQRGKEMYCIQDSTAAIEHILLMAVNYGLGTCWVGSFYENEVVKILNLPINIKPVAIIPIGYPKDKEMFSSRKDIKTLIHYNKW